MAAWPPIIMPPPRPALAAASASAAAAAAAACASSLGAVRASSTAIFVCMSRMVCKKL